MQEFDKHTLNERSLKHDSGIHCDELVSLSKTALTQFVGTLGPAKLKDLDRALRVALDLHD